MFYQTSRQTCAKDRVKDERALSSLFLAAISIFNLPLLIGQPTSFSIPTPAGSEIHIFPNDTSRNNEPPVIGPDLNGKESFHFARSSPGTAVGRAQVLLLIQHRTW